MKFVADVNLASSLLHKSRRGNSKNTSVTHRQRKPGSEKTNSDLWHIYSRTPTHKRFIGAAQRDQNVGVMLCCQAHHILAAMMCADDAEVMSLLYLLSPSDCVSAACTLILATLGIY